MIEDIEFRFIQPARTHDPQRHPPRLQFRLTEVGRNDIWPEWQDVPTIIDDWEYDGKANHNRQYFK